MMIKKIRIFALCALLLFASLGCSAAVVPFSNGTSQKLRIVTTIFPLYDWVREILGERASDVDLVLLLDSGVDLHSFQPTAADIVQISSCDLLVHVGGESDAWLEDALQEATNRNMVVLNLLDALGDDAKEEELVEGMEAEADDADEDDADETEYDEHIWLSLKNAAALSRVIEASLRTLDPDHANEYERNCTAFLGKLNALDTAYRTVVDEATYHTVLFGDRFPFRYLTDDYGLRYYAAFSGCSAESEASFETIVFLANKLDELHLPAILRIETSDGAIARTIASASETKTQKQLVLNSLQSVTANDVRAGVTYLSVMEANLAVLQDALND